MWSVSLLALPPISMGWNTFGHRIPMQPTTVAITNTVFFVPRGLASGSTVLIVFDYVHCCRYQERLFGSSFA